MMSFRTAVTTLLVIVLALALAMMSVATFSVATRTVLPEIQQKASTIARSQAGLIERALRIGIPLESLVGVQDSFEDSLAGSPDMARITFRDASGKIRAQAIAPRARDANFSDPPLLAPILSDQTEIGRVEVDVDPQVLASHVRDIWIDQAIVIFVSIFISLEFIALNFGHGLGLILGLAETRIRHVWRGRFEIARPEDRKGALAVITQPLDNLTDGLAARSDELRLKATKAGHHKALHLLQLLKERFGVGQPVEPSLDPAERVRAALFVFMLSEELTRSFVPHTSRSLGAAIGSLPIEVTTGLPIALFMLVVALAQPILGPLVDRLDRYRMFMLGAALATIGHAGSALAANWFFFLGARGVTALGYALVFVAAQIAIAESARTGGRSRAFSIFIRAITVAGLCGPPLGGIIADRLGSQAGFWAASAVAFCSLWLGRNAFTKTPIRHIHVASAQEIGGTVTNVIRDPLLNGLVFLCALPAKLMLVGFCFYLVPVKMEQDGFSLAAIGRLQMLYPIVMVLTLPFFAYWADRSSKRAPFVVAGGLIAGFAALYPFVETAPLTMAAALIQLSFGQAISIASQSALVTEYAEHLQSRNGTVLGLFRLVERLGNALGPMTAATILATLGFPAATLAMGSLVVGGATIFSLLEFKLGRRPESVSETVT